MDNYLRTAFAPLLAFFFYNFLFSSIQMYNVEDRICFFVTDLKIVTIVYSFLSHEISNLTPLVHITEHYLNLGPISKGLEASNRNIARISRSQPD